MQHITCEKCGSEFDLWETSLPVRDMGSVDCQVCGHELYDWNCAATYAAHLTKRAEWPKT